MTEAWIPWIVVLIAAAVTYFSRGLGVLAGGRIDPSGPLFEWVSCVAYALLAGLVSRMILLPQGPLADAPLAVRLAGVAVALVAFYASGRNLLAGIGAGLVCLALLTILV